MPGIPVQERFEKMIILQQIQVELNTDSVTIQRIRNWLTYEKFRLLARLDRR